MKTRSSRLKMIAAPKQWQFLRRCMLQSSLSPFRSLSPLLWVLFPTLLLAQEESALLKYKFQPGQSLNYLVASQMVATTKVQNAEQDSTNQSSSIKELKIVAVDQQGLATIESSVKRILIKATLPGGGQLDYDSSQTDPVPLPFRMAAESIGKTTSRITLSPDGRIIKAVALQPDGTPVAIPAAGPTPRHDVLPSFPASPVQRGSTWQETFQVEVLGVDNQPRTVQLARKFQVTSISVTPNNQKLVQIGFVVEPAVPHSEPEIISRLTPFLVTGELTFDTSAGAVVAYQSELNREAVDALGPGTLLRMSGKTLEKLVPPQTPPELLKLEE